VKLILKQGGEIKNLIAKLVGGASMFKNIIKSEHSIGFQNVESARKNLAKLGIPIEKEDTGGSSGKIVQMDLRNGMVQVSTVL